MSEPLKMPPRPPSPAPVSEGSALPLMETRRVRLRALRDSDFPFLYRLLTSPEAGGRVRYAGATPSPDKVAGSLWESVLAQFVLEAVGSGEAVGLVAITSPNFRDGYAYVSALATPEVQGMGLALEGVLLGFHYAFSTWPLRKVYMEATEDSYRQFAGGLGVFFVEEGCLQQHAFWNGRYVDLKILAVYRERWQSHAERMLRRLGATPTDG